MWGSCTDLLRSVRPRQWLKNGFVLAPAVFSGHLLDLSSVLPVLGVAAGFCLVSSAGYLVNDCVDKDADRHDPAKRSRPIADGRVSVRAALLLAGLLLAAGLGLATFGGLDSILLAALYAVLSTSYSLFLKRIPIVEAMTIATGFVIRLVAGAVAIPVPVSDWLLACGFLLALLLAFGKRTRGTASAHSRSPLYPKGFVEATVPLLAGVTLVTYLLYTVAPETVSRVGSCGLLWTFPVVLFGILRYLLLLSLAKSADPTEILTRDTTLLAAVSLWALVSGLLLAHP